MSAASEAIATVAIEKMWLEEFVVSGLCGLCANSGVVGPLVNKSPAGNLVVMSARPCICPNGRTRHRFEGSSYETRPR